MNAGHWLVWGFGATVVLSVLMAGSQRLNLTRMNLPYLLGSMFTPDRDRARLLGLLVHLVNGLAFSALYVAAFHARGRVEVWFGALMGLVHAMFVLTVVLPALPALHPRMATAAEGPTDERRLAPPGFLALHYGPRTPISVILSHIVFGAIVGLFYRL